MVTARRACVTRSADPRPSTSPLRVTRFTAPHTSSSGFTGVTGVSSCSVKRMPRRAADASGLMRAARCGPRKSRGGDRPNNNVADEKRGRDTQPLDLVQLILAHGLAMFDAMACIGPRVLCRGLPIRRQHVVNGSVAVGVNRHLIALPVHVDTIRTRSSRLRLG